MAGHVLELQGLGVFCVHKFENYASKNDLTNECNKSQRRYSGRLSTVMFRGTPGSIIGTINMYNKSRKCF